MTGKSPSSTCWAFTLAAVLLLPLTALIEEAVNGSEAVKRLSGNVADLDLLLREESLRKLESAHGGYFAYLAFQPGMDPAIDGYLAEGSLPADSGMSALVL